MQLCQVIRFQRRHMQTLLSNGLQVSNLQNLMCKFPDVQ